MRNETAKPEKIEPATVDEYLRTFSGREGLLGGMGVYRAAFTSIEQTEPLAKSTVVVPVVAIGGAKSLGAKGRRDGEDGGAARRVVGVVTTASTFGPGGTTILAS